MVRIIVSAPFSKHSTEVKDRVAMFPVAFGAHASCFIESYLSVALLSVCFGYWFVWFRYFISPSFVFLGASPFSLRTNCLMG